MKFNKRGMTLVELVVSIALLSVVLGFLFKIVLEVKNESNNAGFAIKNQVIRAEIIKTIQDEVLSMGESLDSCGSDREYVKFYFGTSITFSEDRRTITLNKCDGAKRSWTIKDEGYYFGDIKYFYGRDYVPSGLIEGCGLFSSYRIVIPVKNNIDEDLTIDDIEIITYNYS